MKRKYALSKITQLVNGRAGAQLSPPCSLAHSWQWGLGIQPGLRVTPPRPRQQTESLSPDSADAASGQRPGHDLRALLHEAPDREPEAVAQRVLVL